MNDKIKNTIIILIIILLISYLAASIFKMKEGGFGNVALIKISGLIVSEGADSIFAEKMAVSEEIVRDIEKADADEGIKAVIFEINSPGGTAVASAEIAEAVKKVNKTTVALIREAGTSGAYWIASACDKIVAHPLSITGSIGVIGSYLEFSGLLERYNISYERLVAGEHKDMGTPLKELTESEREILQSILYQMHDYFIKQVAENRELSEDYVREIATGRIYLGKEAKEIGLVDVLGSKDEAIALIKQEANLSVVEFVRYKRQKSLLSSLAGVFSRNDNLEEGLKITT